MMNKKVFVKLIALLMAAAMLLGVCACSATDTFTVPVDLSAVQLLRKEHG